MVRKWVALGLGLAALTAEKAEQMVQDLVRKGELSSQEGRQMLDEIATRAGEQKREIRERVQREVKQLLETSGAASKDEVENLKLRLNKLEEQVKQIQQSLAQE